jgi:hypothetical protein
MQVRTCSMTWRLKIALNWKKTESGKGSRIVAIGRNLLALLIYFIYILIIFLLQHASVAWLSFVQLGWNFEPRFKDSSPRSSGHRIHGKE